MGRNLNLQGKEASWRKYDTGEGIELLHPGSLPVLPVCFLHVDEMGGLCFLTGSPSLPW